MTGWVMVMATPAALLYISRCGLPACFPWLRILYTIGDDWVVGLTGTTNGRCMGMDGRLFPQGSIGPFCIFWTTEGGGMYGTTSAWAPAEGADVKDPSRLPIRVPQSKTVLYRWRSWRKHLRNHSKPFSTIAEFDEKSSETRKKTYFFWDLKKKLDIFFFQI